ncbi:MAG: aminotransferase class I/II-fold pyridoxal phosphate-dependent enzyme [Anaerolineae bacterium]|nr:aminotransferase class I/II-fold pyridoxal phosphate-dependent enzyme [Anaerolineae bacterium]
MHKGKATRAIHGRRDTEKLGANYPIYTSTTFAVPNSDTYEQDWDTFDFYTRISNPTIRNVEEKLAALEEGEDAALFASGMAAIMTTFLTFVSSGEAIASSRHVYGGTYHLLRDIVPRFGIDVHFLDDDELYDLPQYAPQAKLVHFETPVNPTSRCVSIASVVESARQIGALTTIDSTFASPINQNPLRFGVDVVLHSATKYLGGHSDIMAGAAMGSAAHLRQIRDGRKLLGGNSNPYEAALLDRSLRTLQVRVEGHNRTAQALAEFFETEPRVGAVHYPGLPSSPAHAIASSQMTGYGGMLAIELEDLQAAKTFCDSLDLALNAVSLGGTDTLVSIPVLATHIKLSDEELAAAHVTPGTVRISAGLEDVEDLIADFKQALARV